MDKIPDSFSGCHGYHRLNKHTLHKVSVQGKYGGGGGGGGRGVS